MDIKCLSQPAHLLSKLLRLWPTAIQDLLFRIIASVVFLSIISTSHASFPPVIDVVNDSAELRNDARITVDGVWVPSRAMGDLDGDGLGDRIIEINATDTDPCPGVALWLSTQTNTFAFTRTELDQLVRIVDTLDPTSGDCQFRNLRVFTEPRRIGDVNGDGLIDLFINVSGIFNNSPRVIFGTLSGGTQIDPAALDGSNGFRTDGIAKIIFPVGDVNGDTYDDIGHATGLSNLSGVVAGRASFGPTLTLDETPTTEHLVGPTNMQQLRGLGDIDGDGNDDMLVFPAITGDAIENQTPRFIYGATDLSVTSLDDTNARIDRNLPECGTRQCMIFPVGDIDADGRDDILASQRFQSDNIPPRSILYGREGGLAIRNELNDFPIGERTQLVRGNTGTIRDQGEFYAGNFNDPYRTATGQRFDIDGDGAEDLLLEERLTNQRQAWYALFGTPGERPPIRSIDEADGLLGVAFDLGDAISPVTSIAAPELGDINLDGIDDFFWTTRRDIPYVPGRSRNLDEIDALGLGVRRSPSELSLFWQSVVDAASYRIEFDTRFIIEVPAGQTQIDVADDTQGGAVRVTVQAVDANGVTLSTQVRQLPPFESLIDSFSVEVYGGDLLELFIVPRRDEFDRAQLQRLRVVRSGEIVGRSQGLSYADSTVSPGQTYDYQFFSDVLIASNFDNLALDDGPRIQYATNTVTVNTPGNPNVPDNDNNPNDTPEAPTNLKVERYSAFDAEVFWDRADEELLTYDVYRNGTFVRTLSGISFYDPRRPENSGASYDIIAVRPDGSRSTASTIVLPSIDGNIDNGGSENPDAPAAPSILRVVRYSSKDAELFWERATNPLLQYEVKRDGQVLRPSFYGTSYFDTTLAPDAAAQYEVIAIAPDGTRSPASSIQLPGANAESSTPTPQALSAAVYSSTAAELFWARSNEEAGIVETEVSRDGVLIGSSPGTSFFDDTRTEGAIHVYTLVAIDALGNRSAPTNLEVSPL